MSKPLACQDCGLPYADMGVDIALPDQQWKLIAPDDGILCANCICKRVQRLHGTALLCWADRIENPSDGGE